MRGSISRLCLCFLLLVWGIGSLTKPATSKERDRKTETKAFKERFGATAPGYGKVDVEILEYSTPDEMANLADAFRRGGSDYLWKASEKMKKGYLVMYGSGRDNGGTVRIAESFATERGRRIIAIADRPQDITALQFGGPMTGYPFTAVELQLDGAGKGAGALAQFAKVGVSKDGKLVIQNMSIKPLPLLDAHVE